MRFFRPKFWCECWGLPRPPLDLPLVRFARCGNCKGWVMLIVEPDR